MLDEEKIRKWFAEYEPEVNLDQFEATSDSETVYLMKRLEAAEDIIVLFEHLVDDADEYESLSEWRKIKAEREI